MQTSHTGHCRVQGQHSKPARGNAPAGLLLVVGVHVAHVLVAQLQVLVRLHHHAHALGEASNY